MEKKYFETKKGSVEEKINTIASEQPTINATYTPDVKLTTEKKYFETKKGSLEDLASKVVSENNGLVGVGGGRTTKGGPQMYAVTDTYHFGGKGKDDVDMSYKITAHVKANNINSAESAGEAAVKRSREYKEILAKVQKKGYDTTPSIDGGNVTKSSSPSEKVNVSRVSGTTVSNTPLSKREGMDPVNKDAVKKKFDDRKDKDIDNDGDVDSSDKYLHKRRKAISKATSEEVEPCGLPADECWDSHKQVGYKMKGGKRVPNCVPKSEAVTQDDKGEKQNADKHKAYADPKKGEKKPFSTLRKETKLIRLGDNGKTATGQKAAVIDVEPSAKPI